jgi:hypothetical protein
MGNWRAVCTNILRLFPQYAILGFRVYCCFLVALVDPLPLSLSSSFFSAVKALEIVCTLLVINTMTMLASVLQAGYLDTYGLE